MPTKMILFIMRCNDAKHQGPCNWHARLNLRREWSECRLLGYVDFSWLWAFFGHLLCAAQWMTACLCVPGLKEAESILMGSERLHCKVTPAGLACADPSTQKVRLLTETQGVISNWLSSPLSSNVRSHPHYHSWDSATWVPFVLPPPAAGGRPQVSLLGN